jgi:hypothetical protein
MAQPLSNFVDKVSTIIAAWLNNVDQAINGTGTSQQGAGLIPYTPGGVGGQPASPVGSVGAALDGIGSISSFYIRPNLGGGLSLTGGSLTIVGSSGTPVALVNTNSPVSYNNTTGVFTIPTGFYLTMVAIFATGAGPGSWFFGMPSFRLGVDGPYFTTSADYNSAVQAVGFGQAESQKTGQLRIQPSLTQTIANGQLGGWIYKLL